jgi:hypothetical protein
MYTFVHSSVTMSTISFGNSSDFDEETALLNGNATARMSSYSSSGGASRHSEAGLYCSIYIIRASKRNFVKWNKTALGPRRQTETSLKIEDLRSNKTTGKR